MNSEFLQNSLIHSFKLHLLPSGYFESHAADCRLTSSCGTISPRSIWSNPLRIAARNSDRSAMVSSFASAGSCRIESNASSLSLIGLVCINEDSNAMPFWPSWQADRPTGETQGFPRSVFPCCLSRHSRDDGGSSGLLKSRRPSQLSIDKPTV